MMALKDIQKNMNKKTNYFRALECRRLTQVN
jgi:hypothetical protein